MRTEKLEPPTLCALVEMHQQHLETAVCLWYMPECGRRLTVTGLLQSLYFPISRHYSDSWTKFRRAHCALRSCRLSAHSAYQAEIFASLPTHAPPCRLLLIQAPLPRNSLHTLFLHCLHILLAIPIESLDLSSRELSLKLIPLAFELGVLQMFQ